MATEDRGGEGRPYCIRIAIVQLSGDQWGTWIIIRVVKLSILVTTLHRPEAFAAICTRGNAHG